MPTPKANDGNIELPKVVGAVASVKPKTELDLKFPQRHKKTKNGGQSVKVGHHVKNSEFLLDHSSFEKVNKRKFDFDQNALSPQNKEFRTNYMKNPFFNNTSVFKQVYTKQDIQTMTQREVASPNDQYEEELRESPRQSPLFVPDKRFSKVVPLQKVSTDRFQHDSKNTLVNSDGSPVSPIRKVGRLLNESSKYEI